MALIDYLKHKDSCNQRKDWSTVKKALDGIPEGTPGKEEAYKEWEEKVKCNCGVREAFIEFAFSWYKAGIDAALLEMSDILHYEESVRRYFNERYSHTFDIILK